MIAGVLIGLGVGIGWFFGFGPGKQLILQLDYQNKDAMTKAPEMNQPAPDFLLMSTGGEQFRLSDFKGKPVLINFWATWCIPCREEMPLLQRYADSYSQEIIVLGVNFDEQDEEVREFVDSLNLTFPILIDKNGSVTSLYRIRGFPSTMFIDQNGTLRFQHIGILTEGQLAGYLGTLGIDTQ